MLPILYSDRFLEHLTGPYHPEKPERLTAIKRALEEMPGAEQLQWVSPTPLTQRDPLDWINQIHTTDYVQQVHSLAASGGSYLDPDTVVSPHSYEVALLAVNAWLDGVDQVLAHQSPAFVLARPPGHHAVPETGMGFCLFSNAAITAHYALTQPGIERVAILDWDVHHGNGTQAIVESHPQIAYCSLHQSPCYPGTGAAEETGLHGNVLNLPMPAGSTLADYESQFRDKIMPFFRDFKPDLLFVSAGYDANAVDPLAGINLIPQDYGVFTQYCLKLTPKILFGLEGGYDLSALAQSVTATIQACLRNSNTKI
ncbi:histone deacetylase [Acaryochloris sp. IP29b_bin.137]|uniref:histone deacetylase family protein n=1 Tax=Acaryochloris sp. IP29b_bin.137 TaxID=2969217 RepID=UPI0026240736|nr:histone deacetylase [Acaryochloris sp. IP29b_bin.137]